ACSWCRQRLRGGRRCPPVAAGRTTSELRFTTSVTEHLLTTEVLCACQVLSPSRESVTDLLLETGLGDRLRTCERRAYAIAATKKGHLLAFLEPSDGLEPSTPSLPWRCSTN